MKADLKQRLSGLRIEMAPEVMEFQFEHIRAELQVAPAAPRTSPRRLRRFVAIMAASLLLVPVGASVAAENAVPGDALYPVKRTTEWLRGWFDDSIAADHRVDELEVVLDRQADMDVVIDLLRDAEDAVSEHPGDARLNDRLDRARDRVERDYPASDGPATSDHGPTDSATLDGPQTDTAPHATVTTHPPTDEASIDRPASDAPTGDAPTDAPVQDRPADTTPTTAAGHGTTTTSHPPDSPPTTRGGDGDGGGGDRGEGGGGD